jgi:hypothetical protein
MFIIGQPRCVRDYHNRSAREITVAHRETPYDSVRRGVFHQRYIYCPCQQRQAAAPLRRCAGVHVTIVGDDLDGIGWPGCLSGGV